MSIYIGTEKVASNPTVNEVNSVSADGATLNPNFLYKVSTGTTRVVGSASNHQGGKPLGVDIANHTATPLRLTLTGSDTLLTQLGEITTLVLQPNELVELRTISSTGWFLSSSNAHNKATKYQKTFRSPEELPAPIANVITLSDNKTSYKFDGAFDLSPNRLVFAGQEQELVGSACASTSITSDHVGALITCTQSLKVSCITLIGSGTHLISASDASSDSLNVKDCTLIGSDQSIEVTNYLSFIVKGCAFISSTSAIKTVGNVTNCIIAESIFLNITEELINLNGALFKAISIRHNAGTALVTSTGIVASVDSGNILAGGLGTIEMNKIDNTAGGTESTGLSPFDTGWLRIGNNFAADSDRTQPAGWASYTDSEAVTLNLGNSAVTPLKITVDSDSSIETYLPLSIRGAGELWDGVNSCIKPITLGDFYALRLAATLATTSGNPTLITFVLDIGGAATPTNVIFEESQTLKSASNQPISFKVDFFTLTTFLANGGQIFAYLNTGSGTITSRNILISRSSSGAI
jgi:hypothetical protein